MAGSYGHVTNGNGQLVAFDAMRNMLDYEDTGDVYETIEQMYGMIWWLAVTNYPSDMTAAQRIEDARKNWEFGIEQSPGAL